VCIASTRHELRVCAAGPTVPGIDVSKYQRYIDWDLPDPKELPLEEVRRIRDDIERRVRGLAAELGQQTEAGYCGTMAQENIGAWRSRVLEVRKGRPEVIALYSRLARLYEVWARLTESRPRRRVVGLAAVRDGGAVLEVAIGTGAQLVAMARRNPSGRTVGIELADGMLPRPASALTPPDSASSYARRTRSNCRSRTRLSTSW
jgi:sugar phosphate isomerase/epimerase